jgi:hypothetical protein
VLLVLIVGVVAQAPFGVQPAPTSCVAKELVNVAGDVNSDVGHERKCAPFKKALSTRTTISTAAVLV